MQKMDYYKNCIQLDLVDERKTGNATIDEASAVLALAEMAKPNMMSDDGTTEKLLRVKLIR